MIQDGNDYGLVWVDGGAWLEIADHNVLGYRVVLADFVNLYFGPLFILAIKRSLRWSVVALRFTIVLS